jgi:hypothetical protein
MPRSDYEMFRTYAMEQRMIQLEEEMKEEYYKKLNEKYELEMEVFHKEMEQLYVHSAPEQNTDKTLQTICSDDIEVYNHSTIFCPDDVKVCNHSTIFGPLEITTRLRKWWVGNKHADIVKCRCPCKKQHVPICANHMQYKKGCNNKECKFFHPDNMLGTATNWNQLYKLNNELCTQASLIGVDVSLMKFAP